SPHEGDQRSQQLPADGAQLGPMRDRELAEEPVAVRRDRDDHLAAVRPAVPPDDQPALLAAVDQLDGAVVPQLEPLGERPDGRRNPRRNAADGKEELVLARLDADLGRSVLAEAEEAAELVAEFGEGAVLGERDIGGHMMKLYRDTI